MKTPQTQFSWRGELVACATRATLFSLALIGFSFAVVAQSTEHPLVKQPRGERLLLEGRSDDPVEPQADDTTTGFGVPYSRILRDVDPPYEGLMRNFKYSGEVDTKLGDAAASFHADFFRGLHFSTPLDSRTRPETSELKLGNFYVDIQSFGASVLVSDNINLSSNNREADVLAALRLSLGAVFQIGDNLRIGARGVVIYLPFSNEIGIAGFGIDDFFAGLGFTPLASAQFGYDVYLSHWQIEFIDDFSIRHRPYGEDLDFHLFEGVTFEQQEQERNFRVNATRTRRVSAPNQNQRTSRLGVDLLEARNRAGAIATRILPTDTRFELGAFHLNHWYYNDVDENLPNSSDYAFANLINEREDMRFKPFVSFKASTYETLPGWDYRLRGGVHGPITDYINFLGDVGYVWMANQRNTEIWRVRFDHNPTPFFYHQIQFQRGVTEPERDIADSVSYRFRYRINANFQAEGVSSWSHYEDLDNNLSGSDEWRSGLFLNYNWGKRGAFHAGQVYSQLRYDNPRFGSVEAWTTRAGVSYRHSDTLDSMLRYWFRIHDSNVAGGSYYENLVTYTLTKYF